MSETTITFITLAIILANLAAAVFLLNVLGIIPTLGIMLAISIMYSIAK